MDILRIYIVDDHVFIRDGLKLLLTGRDDLSVVGTAARGDEAVEWMRHHGAEVDVVVLDASTKPMDGIRTCREIKALTPACKVVMLMPHGDLGIQGKAVEAGAHGVVLKSATSDELIETIEFIRNGKKILPAAPAVQDVPHEQLTPREYDILRYIVCAELTSAEIANELFLSVHTVEQHRKNIMTKLSLNNTVGLTKWAILNGICSPGDGRELRR